MHRRWSWCAQWRPLGCPPDARVLGAHGTITDGRLVVVAHRGRRRDRRAQISGCPSRSRGRPTAPSSPSGTPARSRSARTTSPRRRHPRACSTSRSPSVQHRRSISKPSSPASSGTSDLSEVERHPLRRSDGEVADSRHGRYPNQEGAAVCVSVRTASACTPSSMPGTPVASASDRIFDSMRSPISASTFSSSTRRHARRSALDAVYSFATFAHCSGLVASLLHPVFGPVVPVADDAAALDRVFSLTGRDPAWPLTGGEATENGRERDRGSALAGLEHLADSMTYQSANDVERDPQRASEHAFTHDTDRGTERERCEYDEDRAIALDEYGAEQSPDLAGSQCQRIAPKCVGAVRAESRVAVVAAVASSAIVVRIGNPVRDSIRRRGGISDHRPFSPLGSESARISAPPITPRSPVVVDVHGSARRARTHEARPAGQQPVAVSHHADTVDEACRGAAQVLRELDAALDTTMFERRVRPCCDRQPADARDFPTSIRPARFGPAPSHVRTWCGSSNSRRADEDRCGGGRGARDRSRGRVRWAGPVGGGRRRRDVACRRY